ncbi:MAG: thiamine-phosphate kinase [Oceanococcaceae bacterium]
MPLDEFGLIQRHFHWSSRGSGTLLGVGDDAAILRATPGHDWVICTDTLVEGRHFDSRLSPADVGWKSLAVNLSDLAAMGATPRGFTLALTLPTVDDEWLSEFRQGLREMATAANVDLVGGDTTRGPLTITITAFGDVPTGQALRRAGARVGDQLWVTGPLGNAALALALNDAAPDALLADLRRPQPRVAAGLALRDHAHAAIDLSDGLAADLCHILDASQVGATVIWADLPRSEPLTAALAGRHDRAALEPQVLLHGGDDYELLLSLPAELSPRALAPDIPWYCIGQVDARPGLRLDRGRGRVDALATTGWNHFP